MRWIAPLFVYGCGLALALPPASAQEKKAEKKAENKAEPVSFSKQIAPILAKKCLACHGERQPQSGYQLHTFDKMFKAGDFGEPPVTAGKPEASSLLKLVSSTKKDVWMPKEGDRLTDAQIALIRQWIAEGAKFDGPDKAAAIASFVPPEYDPPPDAYARPLPITAVAFHPQGTELAVGGYNEITVWNPADGKLVRRIRNVAQRTYGLAYSPDGKFLAAASGTPATLGEVKLFEASSGNPVRVLASMADVAYDVAFSPKGDKIAACAADRSIRIFDVASGKQERIIEDHADWVMAIAWNKDGTRIASASRDKTSKVFDVKTGESHVTYNGHGQTVFGVAFSPDGSQVLTSGADHKIHVWNPADGKKIAEMAGFGNDVYRVICEGDQVYSCSADKTARQFGLANRAQVRAYSPHADWVFTLAAHAASKRLATGTFTGEVHVWNIADGKQIASFVAAPGYKPAGK
jgi:tricorn protease-like protein/mono/diheme cytochrome c family protein